MPPKSAKKKLTKAEKDKLKKEEAERKAQEEEELRIQQEQEEAEAKEREKLEAEERRRLENEERKKRKGQLQELEALWESYRTKLFTEESERRKNAKWARYMLCDGSPDPTIAGEINTFMNLWREEKDNVSIQRVLGDSKLPLKLIAELEFLLADTPAEEISDNEVAAYRGTIKQLQELLAEKLDTASHNLSLQASELFDSDTMNLQKVIGNDTITLCLWGNLSKNPRIKSFEFEEQGFQFELPKLLTLSDVAVRLLITKYDHLSPHCVSYSPRIKKPEEILSLSIPEENPPAEDGEEQKAEGEEAKEGDGEPAEPEREETQSTKSDEGNDKEENEEDEDGSHSSSINENKEDVLAALKGIESEDEGEEKPKDDEEEQPAEEEPLEEDYEIRTPEPLEYEDFDGEDDVIDLRAYHVVGGVYFFNLLHLPPQPKQANSWIITQVQEPPQLRHYDYVADFISPTPGPDKDDEKKSEGSAAPKREEKPPIGVTIKLPGDVYFCEEPQVARWDTDTDEWRVDGFSDHKFDEEQRILFFKTAYYGTLALVQDAHINMPFQSWEIRPRGANHSLLTIIAAIVEVEIEIKDDKVALVAPEDKPVLAHLIKKWMPVPDFITALRRAGVNIFPAEDSFKYVSIQNKNSVTEERLYQQMSMVSSSMAFSWSKWNTEIESDERIVVQGAEHMADEPLMEEDWSLFMITKKRTTKLKMTEFDEAFSDDHADGTEFHADLYHMVMDIVGEEARQRVRDTNYKYIDSVYQMLKNTRLVTYS